jgi:AraC family transcriptional activator of tynA and feaB
MNGDPHLPVEQRVQYFSADHIPPRMRLDQWMFILSESVFPISEWTAVKDFHFELGEARLGCLTASRQTVSAHRSHRTRQDVERSSDRKFLLFVGEIPWEIDHNGHNERILGGDCVLVDSHLEHRIICPDGFRGVILRLPVNWLQTWLPEAEPLVGRRIACDSQWGRIISPIARQLTPELAAAPPLPHGVLVDQLGATLALIAGAQETHTVPDLLRKVQDCIWQRSTELELTAADVAATLNISPRMLHRVLAASYLTFASQLLDARVGVGQQMLASPSFRQLTIAEVARQSGFISPLHFLRALRKRTGQTVLELERPMHRTQLQ